MDQDLTDINHSRLKNIIFLTAIVGGYCAFFIFNTGIFNNNITACPFKLITGIPCPGCGMGRATLSLVHLEIKRAFLYHPLVIPFNVFIIISVGWLLRDIIMKQEFFMRFVKSRPNKWVMLSIFLLLAIIWVRNILIGL